MQTQIEGKPGALGCVINLDGAKDERARTVALSAAETGLLKNYERTADQQYLPELVGSWSANGVKPAPFGHGNYFWANFAEAVAERHNIPVLLLNAAFGGTSVEHWRLSIRF